MTDTTILRLRIMIIDNDTGDAQRLLRMIEHLGHTIDIVDNSQAAVEKLSSENNILRPYDLAIIEYWLHKDETGIELGKKLLALDDYLSIIIYTADKSQETYAEIMKAELPMKGFFRKAEPLNALLPMLNYVMSNKKELLSGETSFFKARLEKFKNKIKK